MTAPAVFSLSASPHEPSKTTALLDAVVGELADRFRLDDHRFLMSDIGLQIGSALTRDEVSGRAREALETAESCELLVVATPTYRATYTGLFKHFFDLVGQDALAHKPVFLSAIGGNNSHSLSVDHQLRPLFAFFRSVSLPIGVFATNADFDEYSAGSKLEDRIKAAVDAAVPVIRGTSRLRAP